MQELPKNQSKTKGDWKKLTVEVAVSLVKLNPDDYLRVTVDLAELDVTATYKKAT